MSGSVSEDSTRVGTRYLPANSTERICRTLEPSEAISSISSNDTTAMRRASGTTRGSVVDAVDVGVDQAFIGLDRRRHGHGRGIGTAAAQRGDVAVGVHALEARHDDHAAGVKVGADARVVDRGDAGLGVGRVGAHGHLPAGVAARGHAFGLQRDGQQAAAGLLAGGGDHVELAAVRHGRNLARQAQQAIGLARHGRRHHDNLVACGVPLRDATRHIPDALDRAHRSTAIFVNDEGHLVLWLGTRPKYVDGQNLIF